MAYTQEAGPLVPVDASSTQYFGQIALSSDGNTAAIGGSGGVGAVWIYVRSGATWSVQAKLVGTGNTGNSGQGTSVASFFQRL
jgi:hypothetical protein